MELDSEFDAGIGNVERPDHSRVTEIANRGMRSQGFGATVDPGGENTVALQHLVSLQNVENRQRGATSERIARVGVRMEEAARDIVVIECLVHAIGRQDYRKRQVA